MLKAIFARSELDLVIILFCCFILVSGNGEKKYDEEEGRAYLKKINADVQVKTTENVLASWAYESNITDENLRFQLDVSAKLANYTKEVWKETTKYPWKTFKDPDVKRQFQKFSVLGTAILSPSKYERFNKIISDMQSVYGKAKLCNYKNQTDCSLQLEPELTEIFVTSRDPDELRYYWEQWRNSAGKPVRKMYKEYVDLSNEAAVLNNFTNNAEFWLKDYEAENFKQQMENLWGQLRPLYLQLHAYVRRRLREQYGEKHVTKRGPIPAHLLGNMWAQSWGNIFDFTAPYPGKPSMDVTPSMVEQNYTPLRMFKLAEEFFTSLDLDSMPDTFWKNSILEKPSDGRDLICHASAWDFYDGKDFRIKQCTRITMEELNTVHHEMGHIQYFLQYKNQPLVYKEGTNPGFHEAVGDVMALSVSTPKHLRKIGLLNETEDDAESEINQLYNMALDKIAFLPFGYLMDQWRWSVFEGKTTDRDYNCKWWQLREKYQGLSPSVIRTEADFDPGAKYHTVGNVPYIRYFVSFIIQFQFHRSLCIAAKEFNPDDPASKPLHKCDIYQSKEAGKLLKKMLQMGSSKPWPDAMEVITGQRDMDAQPLLEYFGALKVWLEKENKRTGEFIGWEASKKECEWEEEGQRALPSDIRGNFEDDNIAYSYAEFVRQDDNAFGFPDYLEEVQPSYHALRHRSKENEFRANYFIPKGAVNKFPSKNIYVTDESYPNSQSDLVDLSKLQLLQNNLQNQAKASVFDGESYKIWEVPKQVSGALQKRRSSISTERSEVFNAILKDVQKLKKSRVAPQNYNGAYKWILSRDVSNEKKKTEPPIDIQEEVQVETEQQSENTNKPDKVEEDQENSEKVLELRPENSSVAFRNPLSKASDTKGDELLFSNTKADAKAECILETAKKFSSKALDYLVPNELLWKAELVKNEAEQMLKNYNLSYYLPSDANVSKLAIRPPHLFDEKNQSNEPLSTRSGLKTVRNILPLYSAPENFKQGQSIKTHLNALETLPKSSESFSKRDMQSKNQLHYKKYDLVNVIPVGDIVDKNKNEVPNKRSVMQHGNELPYVMLVGKLSENQFEEYLPEKKLQKKSYKEYHFNVRTPVVYNSVTITPPGGKSDKGDETKDHWSKVSYRTSRLLNGRNVREAQSSVPRPEQDRRRHVLSNKFFRSVKKNKYNINNIVQYFGCLQLLL